MESPEPAEGTLDWPGMQGAPGVGGGVSRGRGVGLQRADVRTQQREQRGV